MSNTCSDSSSSYNQSPKAFPQKIELIISRSPDHHHDHVVDDPERTSAAPEAEPQPSVPAAAAARPKTTKYQNLDWAKIIVVYCLSTAVAMALTPVQAHSNQLPLTFQFLGLTILFSFACIMVSKFIHNNNCPRITVDLFHSFGVFFGSQPSSFALQPHFLSGSNVLPLSSTWSQAL